MKRSMLMAAGTLVFVAAMAAGCGGGSSSPSSPTPTTPPASGGGSTTATITIGSNGAISPTSVTIARGGRVTFVNNHTRNHDMSSDPHPEHTDCPEMAQVGFLTPGQTRTSGNFNTARTCGFHDHEDPTNRSLQGSIIIQ
jgi:plastocyanin